MQTFHAKSPKLLSQLDSSRAWLHVTPLATFCAFLTVLSSMGSFEDFAGGQAANIELLSALAPSHPSLRLLGWRLGARWARSRWQTRRFKASKVIIATNVRKAHQVSLLPLYFCSSSPIKTNYRVLLHLRQISAGFIWI